jgi:hypothetical protein
VQTPFRLSRGQVRDQVNHKYDLWHREFLGKFAALLSFKTRSLVDTMASTRGQLEAVSFDGISGLDVVAAFSKVREALSMVSGTVYRGLNEGVFQGVPLPMCLAGAGIMGVCVVLTICIACAISFSQLPEWHSMWTSFADGEKLLQKQRYPLPADWLLVSNLEGELNSVEQAAGKRNADMSNRLPALRSQVAAAGSALVDSVNAYITEWERDRYGLCTCPRSSCVLQRSRACLGASPTFGKPLGFPLVYAPLLPAGCCSPISGSLNVEDALRVVASFEKRHKQLSDEWAQLAEAKRVLGVESHDVDRLVGPSIELGGLKETWTLLRGVLKGLNELKDTPWTSVHIVKVRVCAR